MRSTLENVITLERLTNWPLDAISTNRVMLDNDVRRTVKPAIQTGKEIYSTTSTN